MLTINVNLLIIKRRSIRRHKIDENKIGKQTQNGGEGREKKD